MNKCLKVVIRAQFPADFLSDFVQKQAKKLNLEGTAQTMPGENHILLKVCGDVDDLDQFIDAVHKALLKHSLIDIEIEPFLRDKDYRNVFRILE